MNNRTYIYYAPVLCWSIFILIACLFPGTYIPKTFPSFTDLVVHFTMYSGLSILFLYARFKTKNPLNTKQLVLFFILFVCFGFIIEVLQGTLPIHRSFDVYDILLNSTGCMMLFFKQKIDTIFNRLCI